MKTPSPAQPLTLEPTRRIAGTVTLPGDKSISHRYAILGALSEGTTTVDNYSPSQDCQATLDCLSAAGVVWARRRDRVEITGTGGEMSPPARPLDVGNSGTTIRLLAGVLAAQPFTSVLQGDASVSARPMKRIMTPLTRMGARVKARDGEFPPLTIEGSRLRAIRHQPPMASAQVKSCVLLAGLGANGETIVVEPVATRDHSERALPVFGAQLWRHGEEIRLPGPQTLKSAAVRVPGDFSAAAFFLLAAALCPGSDVRLDQVGVNPTRTGLLDLLERAGANLSRVNPREINGEPVCDLRAGFREDVLERFPSQISGPWIPNLIDEIPALAVFGVRLKNGFSVCDATELRKKETDRIRAVAVNLAALGVRVEEAADGFHIPPGQTLRGGKVRTFGDHRVAMAFGIASLIAEEPIELDEPGCAAVSFPNYFEELLSTRRPA